MGGLGQRGPAHLQPGLTFDASLLLLLSSSSLLLLDQGLYSLLLSKEEYGPNQEPQQSPKDHPHGHLPGLRSGEEAACGEKAQLLA